MLYTLEQAQKIWTQIIRKRAEELRQDLIKSSIINKQIESLEDYEFVFEKPIKASILSKKF